MIKYIIIFLLLAFPCRAENIDAVIDSLNIDNAFDIVGRFAQKRGEIAVVKRVNNKAFRAHIRKHYKEMIYTIGLIESDYFHKQGLIDNNDVGYWQINLYWWDIKTLSQFRKITIEQLQKVNISCEFALYILVYNSALWYIKSHEKYDVVTTMTAYHNPMKQDQNYRNKIIKARE